MKKTDLEKYKQALLVLQARLRGDVHLLTSKALAASGSGNTNHIAELGTDAWEQDSALRFAENDQEMLEEIKHALGRIADGTFGQCQDCVEEGKPKSRSAIAKSRLNAIPYARNCIDCKRRREEMV